MSGLAVVTGGAGGLGLAVARRLGEAGHALVLADRDPRVEEAAAGLGAGASWVAADLATAEGVDAVVSMVDGLDGELEVLVNNAGIIRDARLRKLSEEDFAAVIEVNLLAPMRLTLALRDRFADGGAVVSMSSRAALGNFGQANYSASKSGLVGFTRALALEWAPRVRVNALAPGLIDSPMTQAMPDEVRAKLVERIPAGRIGTPEDVAEAVAFLASPAAGYVTGQVLLACGGRSIAP